MKELHFVVVDVLNTVHIFNQNLVHIKRNLNLIYTQINSLNRFKALGFKTDLCTDIQPGNCYPIKKNPG